MKKKISSILIAAMLAVSILGCGPDGEKPGPEPLEETWNLRAEIEALKNGEKKENSSDAYAASLNALLQVEKPAEAQKESWSSIFLGASRANYFQKYITDDLKKTWMS